MIKKENKQIINKENKQIINKENKQIINKENKQIINKVKRVVFDESVTKWTIVLLDSLLHKEEDNDETTLTIMQGDLPEDDDSSVKIRPYHSLNCAETSCTAFNKR